MKYHFIGIGGIGMSALAKILSNNGKTVTGSDLKETNLVDVKVYIGQKEENITVDMTVIYSSDIKEDNPELLAAKKLNCPLLHRSELLAKLLDDKKGITVTGTHGKTTTSSMLATIFEDTTFIVGGIIPQFNSNSQFGNSPWIIAEADESDGTHTRYRSHAAIITNIDTDHMNHYKTEENLIASFQTFIDQTETLVWGGDDPRLCALNPPGTSYGFSPTCDAKIIHYYQEGWSATFSFSWKGKDYQNIQIPLPGKYNALNALAAFVLSLQLGLPEERIRYALQNFSGIKRRCEKRGEIHGITFIDDYAHHPEEIKALLSAIRKAEREKRLVVVFQPHRPSRMAHCLGHFHNAFQEADLLLISDIHMAGEKPIDGVTTEKIVKELSGEYIQLDAVSQKLRRHDTVVTIGAGSITDYPDKWIEELKKNPPPKLHIGVISGGRSSEHEISLLSSANVVEKLSSEHYEVKHFHITKEGAWGKEASTLLSQSVLDQLIHCDAVFPVLHGPFGEDGTIQGFFEMLDVPYIGTCHRSSAIAMDKIQSKKLALYHNVPTPKFLSVDKSLWRYEKEKVLQHTLSYPCFVKASHLGSSIGVIKVNHPDQLEEAIEKVFKVDTDLYLEEAVVGRELEFSVLGNDYVQAFPPGEILSQGQVYDYRGKYSSQGMRAIPKADIAEHIAERGKSLAVEVFKATGCQGMARVDFFLDSDENYWFNEINPIPGFTDISLFPKGCEINGLSQEKLMDRLIILGLHRQRKNHVLRKVDTSEWL